LLEFSKYLTRHYAILSRHDGWVKPVEQNPMTVLVPLFNLTDYWTLE